MRKRISSSKFLRELALIEKEYKKDGGSKELYQKAVELYSLKPGFIEWDINLDKYKK